MRCGGDEDGGGGGGDGDTKFNSMSAAPSPRPHPTERVPHLPPDPHFVEHRVERHAECRVLLGAEGRVGRDDSGHHGQAETRVPKAAHCDDAAAEAPGRRGRRSKRTPVGP